MQQEPDYTVFLIPKGGRAVAAAAVRGQPLPIARIAATHSNDRVGRMIDGDLLSRWDTAGPQDPTSAVTIDLGAPKQVEGVETLIGGYLADFPRALTIEVSSDGTTWEVAWQGQPALMTYISALETPRTVPLRFPLNRTARHIRLRQTDADPGLLLVNRRAPRLRLVNGCAVSGTLLAAVQHGGAPIWDYATSTRTRFSRRKGSSTAARRSATASSISRAA